MFLLKLSKCSIAQNDRFIEETPQVDQKVRIPGTDKGGHGPGFVGSHK